MLVGVVVGIMFGVTYEKFARARRDASGAKKVAGQAVSAYRTHHLPRMLVIGFICVCAAIVAFRVLLGTAE
jgi:uncharacterized membrane protein